MTPEAQRIAIAEANPCPFVGLKKRGLWYRANASGYTHSECDAGRYTREEAKRHEYLQDEPVTIHEFSMPDYLNDLNACMQIVAALDGIDQVEFAIQLYHVSIPRESQNPGHIITWPIASMLITATAPQHCEAYLRTIGKWSE